MRISQHEQAKGIVLLESLRPDVDHSRLFRHEVLRYPYLLDGVKPVTSVKLALPIDEMASLLLGFSQMLQEEDFYAHFIYKDTLFVVFPRCVVQANKHLPESFDTCRVIGALFSIPVHQMKFERLFIEDHPTDI